jgi:hypothetical protein
MYVTFSMHTTKPKSLILTMPWNSILPRLILPLHNQLTHLAAALNRILGCLHTWLDLSCDISLDFLQRRKNTSIKSQDRKAKYYVVKSPEMAH